MTLKKNMGEFKADGRDPDGQLLGTADDSLLEPYRFMIIMPFSESSLRICFTWQHRGANETLQFNRERD